MEAKVVQGLHETLAGPCGDSTQSEGRPSRRPVPSRNVYAGQSPTSPRPYQALYPERLRTARTTHQRLSIGVVGKLTVVLPSAAVGQSESSSFLVSDSSVPRCSLVDTLRHPLDVGRTIKYITIQIVFLP